MTNPHQELEDQISIQAQVLEYKLKNQAKKRAEARALIAKGQALLDELDQKVASNRASIESMAQELGKRQAMTLGPWIMNDHHGGNRYIASAYDGGNPRDKRDSWLYGNVWLRIAGGDICFWTASFWRLPVHIPEIKYDPPKSRTEDWEKFKKLTDEKLVEMGYYLINE